MKQFNFFRILLIAMLLGVTGMVNAQIHPLAFGIGGVNTSPNWYANYVGMRFEVVTPLSDAGIKAYTMTNDGTGSTSDWGGAVTTPIVDVPVIMPQAGDSACSIGSVDHTITVDMTGQIGLVYRGAAVLFGDKAADCQNAGAIACVIINNVPGAPVGMAAGGAAATDTIPIFMISKEDGDVLDSLWNAGIKATITITPWGQGLTVDLGFVPNGGAMGHSYSIPANQLLASGNPAPYNMLDGAFIANFGTHNVTGVQLKTTTTFYPTTGSAGTPHSSEVDLASFTVADSIYAMFSHTDYSLSASGTGYFDVNYLIESDSTDLYPADNSMDVKFYVSDSVYSKGRYDFTAQAPSRSLYEGFNAGNEFIWGPMYYVANAGTALSAVQYSIAKNYVAGDPSLAAGANNIYVFKWVDSLGGVPDSVVEDGELELVGSAVKNYDVPDTSEATMYQKISVDGSVGGPEVPLEANSWYYVCIDVPSTAGTATQLFLGCDGQLSPYPRIYGRFHADGGLLDYSSVVIPNDSSTLGANTAQGNPPTPGAMTSFINSVDSFVYSSMVGIIPAVSIIADNHPNAVKSVTKPLADVSMFPNPAKDYLNVSASFSQNEKTVSYEIIDGLARFVSKETHTNVQNDKYTVNTSALAAGNYYLVINAEGKIMTKKFVVIK